MLKRLHLTHFRSYETLTLELEERVTVILGPNATGKTNILEAIYVASTGQSFRADDSTLITEHQDGFRVDAEYEDEILSVVYRLLPRRQKRFLRNEVGISRHTLLGLHPVVLFEPGHLQLLGGTPALRRQYMDMLLAQTSEPYRRSLILYRRLIKQRNALLYQNKRSPVRRLEDQLFILDTQLAEPAEAIYNARSQALVWLEPQLQRYIEHIAGERPRTSLSYKERSSDFLRRLHDNRARDIAIGTTSTGPHREDWQLYRNEVLFHETASRGENRTTLLALKLCEVLYIREKRDGMTPTLLLDDVFSELDESRRHLLVDVLKDVQTVITTADIDRRLELPAQTIDLTRRK
ncbi:DNA replication and repair protein RecF [bacterium]|nr:DNA replication and repair protein RecF [bacterium]